MSSRGSREVVAQCSIVDGVSLAVALVYQICESGCTGTLKKVSGQRLITTAFSKDSKTKSILVACWAIIRFRCNHHWKKVFNETHIIFMSGPQRL